MWIGRTGAHAGVVPSHVRHGGMSVFAPSLWRSKGRIGEGCFIRTALSFIGVAAGAAPAGQYISRCRPSVANTLLEISSIEVCVVLRVGMRSMRNMVSAADTSRLQTSALA